MVSLTNTAAKAGLNAIADLVDVGTTDSTGDLKFYDGSVPTDADTALSGNTLLATVDLQDPAFDAAADAGPGAVVTVQGVPLSDVSIDNTGTCSFARMTDRDNNVIAQFTVGTAATDIIVDTVSFVAAATFSIVATSTITLPES